MNEQQQPTTEIMQKLLQTLMITTEQNAKRKIKSLTFSIESNEEKNVSFLLYFFFKFCYAKQNERKKRSKKKAA